MVVLILFLFFGLAFLLNYYLIYLHPKYKTLSLLKKEILALKKTNTLQKKKPSKKTTFTLIEKLKTEETKNHLQIILLEKKSGKLTVSWKATLASIYHTLNFFSNEQLKKCSSITLTPSQTAPLIMVTISCEN